MHRNTSGPEMAARLQPADTARALGQPPLPPSQAVQRMASLWLMRSLDEIDYGAVLVGDDGLVHYCNPVARETLDRQHPLVLDGQLLRTRGDDDAVTLQLALDAASARGLRRLVSLGQGALRTHVAVVPLELSPGVPSGACLLLLGRREACPRLSLQWFARAHALTPAESRVLEALAEGHDPREIALAFDVGLATVRSQLGSVRAKVGVASIRELLQRLATLPPMLSALRGS